MLEYVNQAWGFLFDDLKIYWAFAIFGSGVFVLQLILAMFGFGMGGDVDIDGDGGVDFGEHLDTGLGDFQFFSVRSVIAFITFFGWGGVLWGQNGIGGFFAACACGLLMMFLTAVMFFCMLKLQHSGNVSPEDIIGQVGNVYLRVPGGNGNGRVTVSVGGSTREIIAMADDDLPKGTPVKVVRQVDNRRYLVEKA